MALDAPLLLPCPLCRELPDESPLADVTRWALFGVERREGTAVLALGALAASVEAAATASGTAGLTLPALGASLLGDARTLGVAVLALPSLTATGALVARVEGTVAAALSGLAVAATGTTYAAPPTGTRQTVAVTSVATSAALSAPRTAVAASEQSTGATITAPRTAVAVVAVVTSAEVTLSTVTIGQGDTLPVLTATLSSNGSAVNLTGAAVQCRIRFASGGLLTKSATLVTPSSGIVSVTFAATDLEPGRHRVQFVVTYGGGDTQTFPNTGEPLWLAVSERL